METLRPKVFLANWTPKILETIYWCMKVQKEPVPDDIDEVTKNVPQEELEATYKQVLKDYLSPFFEWINFSWKLENVSRSLQQQLTRSRIGFAFSIQSLRVVNVGQFATEGRYHMSATVKDKEFYAYAMGMVETFYNHMISNGETVQDARGVLPLNIYSTITMTCNLKSLIGLINKRTCLKTQGEFQYVSQLMVAEIKSKLPKVVGDSFGEPCRFGPCILIPENEQQLKEGKFEGKSNTDHVCPLYIKLGMSEKHPEWTRVQQWKDSVHSVGQKTEDEKME